MNAATFLKLTVVWILCSELVAVNVLKYIDGISGQITSPDYPGNYPNNANYTWIIRTGSRSAKVTFRIIEMNIEKWECDDYLEITELEPCCFRLLKRCGHLENYNLTGRGKKIRVSFISDESMTEKGFSLTWKVTLPPTKALPTQKMLATTTKYMVRTSKKMEVKTTAFQQTTTTPSSQVTSTVLAKIESTLTSTGLTTAGTISSTVQAMFTSAPRTTEYTTDDSTSLILIPESPSTVTKSVSSTTQDKITSTSGTTESTTDDTSTYKYTSPTASSTLKPEFPSTVDNQGRITSQSIPTKLLTTLSIKYSETKRTTPKTRSRPLTLSSTTRSSNVELTTLVFNATTNKEDKNTFDIQKVYLIIGLVVVDFLLLLVVCVCIYRRCTQTRALQKNLCQQKRDEGARDVINNAYCISVHVYDDIPVDAVCELETSPEENNEEVEEQSTLYDNSKCWRNEYDKTQSAMDEYNRDTEHTYGTCERFYFTLEATHPRSITQTATPTTTQRDSTNVYHTLNTHFINSSQPK